MSTYIIAVPAGNREVTVACNFISECTVCKQKETPARAKEDDKRNFMVENRTRGFQNTHWCAVVTFCVSTEVLKLHIGSTGPVPL
jgi:hypothetical protein